MPRLFVLFQWKEHTNKFFLFCIPHIWISQHWVSAIRAAARWQKLLTAYSSMWGENHQSMLIKKPWHSGGLAHLPAHPHKPQISLSQSSHGVCQEQVGPAPAATPSCRYLHHQLPQGNYQPVASIRPAPALPPQEHSCISFCFTCLTLFHIDAFL